MTRSIASMFSRSLVLGLASLALGTPAPAELITPGPVTPTAGELRIALPQRKDHVTYDSIRFPHTKLGRTSKPPLKIEVSAKEGPVSLSVELSGKDSRDFKLVPEPPKSLLQNESFTFTVIFKPKKERRRRATLGFTVDGSESRIQVVGPFRGPPLLFSNKHELQLSGIGKSGAD